MICRDGIAHYRHHLNRHLNSQRHKQTVGHLSRPPLPSPTPLPPHPLPANQDGVEPVVDLSDGIIDQFDTLDDDFLEVSCGLHCNRWLMTFTGRDIWVLFTPGLFG